MARKSRKELIEEFNNLDFTSDFLFSYLMKDENLCKKLIELLLKIKVSKIVYHKTQKLIKLSPKSRGVRFDAYVMDESKVYDIEMQCNNYKNLPQRARYYQSIIDVSTLKKRKNFDSLTESYVIFICKSDPLGGGIPVYTVEQRIREAPDVKYDDFSRKVFYNSRAWSSCKDEEIKSFLKYLSTKEISSDFTDELKSLVARSKENMSLRDKFIYLREKRIEKEVEEMEMREEAMEAGWNEGWSKGWNDGNEQGIKQGIEQGIDRGKREATERMVLEFLKLGKLSIEEISAAANLSAEEINQIAEKEKAK